MKKNEMTCCKKCKNDYTIDPTAISFGIYCLASNCECHKISNETIVCGKNGCKEYYKKDEIYKTY